MRWSVFLILLAGALTAFSGAAPIASAAPIAPEFAINTSTEHPQGCPDVAALPNGDFVAVWESHTMTADLINSYGRRFDTNGAPLSGEILLNTSNPEDQEYPEIVMRPGGGFLAAWHMGLGTGDADAYAQLFDATNAKDGGEFGLNDYTALHQYYPQIGIAPDGTFVVTWSSMDQDGSSDGIYARMFEADGDPVDADEWRVNVETDSSQFRSVIGMDADGDFVIAWQSLAQDGDGWGVFLRRFDADGTPLSADDVLVNTETSGHQAQPEIAMNAAGDFVIVWHSEGQDGDGYGIFAQRYNAAGVALTTELPVNVYTAGQQSAPQIAIADDGSFVVAWSSQEQDGDGYGVYARKFDGTGDAVGDEFRVNVTTASDQNEATVAMFSETRFVVVFKSWAGDTDEQDVWGRIFECVVDQECDDEDAGTNDTCEDGLCTFTSVDDDDDDADDDDSADDDDTDDDADDDATDDDGNDDDAFDDDSEDAADDDDDDDNDDDDGCCGC